MFKPEQLITARFGSESKWRAANDAIWHYFQQHQNDRLGLSQIRSMAAEIGVSLEDLLSVLSLLTGPTNDFVKCVFYHLTDAGGVLMEDSEIGEIRPVFRKVYPIGENLRKC